MPEERLAVAIFKDAVFEIVKAPHQRDISKITRLNESMNFLVENSADLRDDGKYWPYIEAAVRHVYPGLGQTNVLELKVLLNEERDLLTKLEKRKTLVESELQQILTFCQEMWYQLELLERGLSPHR